MDANKERDAIERIIGRPLSQEWPETALKAGTRVRIVKDPDWDGPWKEEFEGVIDDFAAPEPVPSVRALPGELRYWVSFDSPQYDYDNDGPYVFASVWGRYVRPIEDSHDSAGQVGEVSDGHQSR